MAVSSTSAAEWLRRWDAQQQLHIPYRDDRFTAIIAALAAFAGETPRVLDLGSGPGSLSVRVLERIPGAEIVAVDADPVLLSIGRASAGADGRITFLDADLRGDWLAQVPVGPYDAAVSTTALHWLRLEQLLPFYTRLAEVLRPGGVFLNGDRFDFDHDQKAIARTATMAQPEWPPVPEGAEDWDAWWAAVEADRTFGAEVAQRRARGHEHPHDHQRHTYEFHRATLLAAGFAEVGTVWQRLVNRVLVAVR